MDRSHTVLSHHTALIHHSCPFKLALCNIDGELCLNQPIKQHMNALKSTVPRDTKLPSHQDKQKNSPTLQQHRFRVGRWNVAGAFLSPNGLTAYESNPEGVTNTAISCARLDKGTCQYPLRRSNLLMNLVEPT